MGHYRVKMALDSLGYRYGHTTVWQMVALYKQAHPPAPRAKRLPNPGRTSQQATAPHQVWFADLRYLVKIDGQWLYSILIFDGYSRAIVGAGLLRPAEPLAAGPGLPPGDRPVGRPGARRQ